jgi:hypothetical protein
LCDPHRLEVYDEDEDNIEEALEVADEVFEFIRRGQEFS